MDTFSSIARAIATILALLTSECVKNLFENPQEFQNLDKKINLCEIIKNDVRFPQDLRDIISMDDTQCISNLTASYCNEIFSDAKKDFKGKINRTIRSFYQDDMDMTLPYEKCIQNTFAEYNLVDAYLKLFLDPDVIYNNKYTGNETEMLSTSIRIVRSFCQANELYSERFDSHMRTLLDMEPCSAQYLIDRGFVIGNLMERPKNCETNDFRFQQLINSDFLLRNYSMGNFYASEYFAIKECFLNKTLELEIPQKLIGIEYSYRLQAPEYDADDEKKKYVELMTLKDKIIIECMVI